MKSTKHGIIENILLKCEEKIIPFSVFFEITYHCNLNCIYCYIRPNKKNRNKSASKELSTNEVKNILSQLADANCLILTITGGEPLLRKDFFAIVSYAQKKAFLIRLFTNGTLIDEGTADKLKQFNVAEVDISLHSDEPSIHDSITRVKGSHSKTMKAIKLLKERGIRITIKSPVIKQNFNQINALKRVAEEIGAKYNFDPMLSPADNGDKSMLSMRIDDIMLKDFLVENLIHDLNVSPLNKSKRKSKGPLCGVGKNDFAISPYGIVYPCIQMRLPAGNLKEESLQKIWKNSEVLNSLRQMNIFHLTGCLKCDKINYCLRCPGLAYMEEGDLYGPSNFACKMAEILKSEGVK